MLDEYNYITITRGIKLDSVVGPSNNHLKVNDVIVVRAIRGNRGRIISRAEDGRVILFDNTDPSSQDVSVGEEVEVKIIRSQPNFLIARKISGTINEQEDPIIKNSFDTISELYKEFLDYKNFIAGEGIKEKSVFTWMEERYKAKSYYMKKFHPDNINELTIEEFDSFLYFKNNRAWTMLYRQGKSLLQDFEDTKRNIVYLQNEDIPVETRLREIMLGGKYWKHGFGKNITTGILHTCDPIDKYGVWNNRTEDGLKHIGKLLKLKYNDHGLSYSIINTELNKLKNGLNTDLIMLDGLMWYVSKKKNKEIL